MRWLVSEEWPLHGLCQGPGLGHQCGLEVRHNGAWHCFNDEAGGHWESTDATQAVQLVSASHVLSQEALERS